MFVPFDTVTVLLQRRPGVQLNHQTIWNWVQDGGQIAMEQLQSSLEQLAAGTYPVPEVLSPQIAGMPLILGADGVMVPIRPNMGKPNGKTQWREVKVAILVRLGRRLTRTGRDICQKHQRRLVAGLGDIEALRPRLLLEALRARTALRERESSGLVTLDGVFGDCIRTVFPRSAIGIIDFYHAAQNLWKAFSAALDGRTTFFESLV